LSAKRYAFTWAGVRSVATWTGTCLKPNFSAALYGVCPQMMAPSASMTMGWRKPLPGGGLMVTAPTRPHPYPK